MENPIRRRKNELLIYTGFFFFLLFVFTLSLKDKIFFIISIFVFGKNRKEKKNIQSGILDIFRRYWKTEMYRLKIILSNLNQQSETILNRLRYAMCY